MKKEKLFLGLAPNSGVITIVVAESMEEAQVKLGGSDLTIDKTATLYDISNIDANQLNYLQLDGFTIIKTEDYIKYVYDNVKEQGEEIKRD